MMTGLMGRVGLAIACAGLVGCSLLFPPPEDTDQAGVSEPGGAGGSSSGSGAGGVGAGGVGVGAGGVGAGADSGGAGAASSGGAQAGGAGVGGTPSSVGYRRPAEGLYRYDKEPSGGVDEEKVASTVVETKLLAHTWQTPVTATVRHVGDDCWTWRLELVPDVIGQTHQDSEGH